MSIGVEADLERYLGHGYIPLGWIPVQSSNVYAFRYFDPAEYPMLRYGVMQVCFLGGTGSKRSGPGPVYEYDDVSRVIAGIFATAPSYGQAVWRLLRDKYPYRKVA